MAWSGAAGWIWLLVVSRDSGSADLLLAGDGSWARRSPSWSPSGPPGQCRLGGGEADLAYYRSIVVSSYVYCH